MVRGFFALLVIACLATPGAAAEQDAAPKPAAVKALRTTTGLAYEIQGKGPVVVLITGSNLDRRMWAREVEWLAPTHTVVTYDLRAHGQSSLPDKPFSHVEDLLSLLDELKVPKATLIGLSAGAVTALDAALAAPERVERIVLAGPAISGYVPKEQPVFVGDLMAALKARDYKQAGEVLLTTPIFAAPPGAHALVRQMVMENDRLWTVPREMMKAPARPAIDQLEQIKVPTLVLVGEKDVPASLDQASILARRIPGARVVIVPAGGHLLNLTSPQEFKVEVSEFLRPK